VLGKVWCRLALLTIKQTSQRLNVSEATVYDLCAKRKLPHVRIGSGRGTIRIDDNDLTAFIEGCKIAPQPSMNTAGPKHIEPPRRATPEKLRNLSLD
jgi:excisionase family DNA binding protein